MFLFHLTSLCLSLLFFTAQPTQAAGKSVEFTIPTNSNPTSKQYLEEHGYSLCDINDSNSGFKTYSLYYGTSYSDTVQDLALHVGLNTERKVTTIFNNNLEHEAYREGYLELDEIFHSLCLSQNIDFNRMEWIVMDVYDRNVNAAIRHYRGNNHLTDKAQIRVTPKDMDWSTFSTMHYYETAAKMVPGKEIDRILVIQQERQMYGGTFQAAIVETMWFSFKNPMSQDGATSVDPADAHAAELVAEDNLKAAVQIAKTAFEAHAKAFWNIQRKFTQGLIWTTEWPSIYIFLSL